MFCERGVRTFETYTRNMLDLLVIPIIKKESHCPIVIDPSLALAGRTSWPRCVGGLVAMGADALLIEGQRRASLSGQALSIQQLGEYRPISRTCRTHLR